MKGMTDEFPNPILFEGNDDYKAECSFKTELDFDSENNIADSITINVSYTLDCSGLQSYINSGEAVVAVQVVSPAASYSKLFLFKQGLTTRVLSLQEYDIVDELRITGLVLAAKPIDEFSCPDEFNPLYFDSLTFRIRKGDVLASENDHILDIKGSKSDESLTSIFFIKEDKKQENDIEACFDESAGGKILIKLRPELFGLYGEFCQRRNCTLVRFATANVVYPVLIEALAIMQKAGADDEADVSQRRWFRCIEAQLEESEFEDLIRGAKEGLLVPTADKLLDSISMDAFAVVKRAINSTYSDEETEIAGAGE